MFIAGRDNKIPLSPRGAACVEAESGKTGSGRRRGWVPQPVGRGNLAPTIEDVSVAGDSILPLAPEGRHVYSTRDMQIP